MSGLQRYKDKYYELGSISSFNNVFIRIWESDMLSNNMKAEFNIMLHDIGYSIDDYDVLSDRIDLEEDGCDIESGNGYKCICGHTISVGYIIGLNWKKLKQYGFPTPISVLVGSDCVNKVSSILYKKIKAKTSCKVCKEKIIDDCRKQPFKLGFCSPECHRIYVCRSVRWDSIHMDIQYKYVQREKILEQTSRPVEPESESESEQKILPNNEVSSHDDRCILCFTKIHNKRASWQTMCPDCYNKSIVKKPCIRCNKIINIKHKDVSWRKTCYPRCKLKNIQTHQLEKTNEL